MNKINNREEMKYMCKVIRSDEVKRAGANGTRGPMRGTAHYIKKNEDTNELKLKLTMPINTQLINNSYSIGEIQNQQVLNKPSRAEIRLSGSSTRCSFCFERESVSIYKERASYLSHIFCF